MPKIEQLKTQMKKDLGDAYSDMLDDDCVDLKRDSVGDDLFQGTNKSSFMTYKYKKGDLDKIQEAAMALLYAKYNKLFEKIKTFIPVALLDKIKEAYADETKCPPKPFHPIVCVQRFLKAFSAALKLNVVAFPLIAPKDASKIKNGNTFEPFKITNGTDFTEVSIYFDYGVDQANVVGEDDYNGVSNIIGAVDEDVLKKIKDDAGYEWVDPEAEPAASVRKSPTAPASRSSIAAPDTAAPSSRSSAPDTKAPLKAAPSARSSAAPAPSASSSSSEPAPRPLTRKPASFPQAKTRKEKKERTYEWPKDAPSAAVLAEIIDGSNDDKAIKKYTKSFDGRSMLTKNQAGIKPYTVKNARQRYDEAKSRNLFPSIIPAYMEKCNLTMKRNGLQVIYITPHISRIISILGFESPIKPEIFDKIKSFANSEQLRTALQFRNLLGQINRTTDNTETELVPDNGKFMEMSSDTICKLGKYPLEIFSYPFTPQTILLGVQRATAKMTDPKLQTLDRITSMFTYKPSSLDDDEKLGANAVIELDRKTVIPDLTKLWKEKQLAYFDIGCASSPKTKNNLLYNNKAHFALLMCYAFLNILKETHKSGRKYQGICVKLIAQTVYKTDKISNKMYNETTLDESKGNEEQKKYKKYLLQNMIQNDFKFRECTLKYDPIDDVDECKYFALYGDDQTFIDLIEAIDKKLDKFTSPYMQEVCKAGVCK